jgi:hypothetical protein
MDANLLGGILESGNVGQDGKIIAWTTEPLVAGLLNEFFSSTN